MFFGATAFGQSPFGSVGETIDVITICLLYTSDAADE